MKDNVRFSLFVIIVVTVIAMSFPMSVSAQWSGGDGIPPSKAEGQRTEFDSSLLRIVFVTPWVRSDEIEDDEIEDQDALTPVRILLAAEVEALRENNFNMVQIWRSEEDQFDEADRVVATISLDDQSWEGQGPVKTAVVEAPGSEFSGLGVGSLLAAAVAVNVPEDKAPEDVPFPVEVEPKGSVAPICTGFQQASPVDLRIIDVASGDVIEEVPNPPGDFSIDASSIRDLQEEFQSPQFQVVQNDEEESQCSGDLGTITFSVNQVKPACDDDEEGAASDCLADIRCAAGSIGFDIWYVETGAPSEKTMADAINGAKRLNPHPQGTFFNSGGSRYFRVYSSRMTPDWGEDSRSSILEEDLAKFGEDKYEDGEIGDAVYGLWGFWGPGPVAKRPLYNMIAQVRREDLKGIGLDLDNSLDSGAIDRGGMLVLYVYDPAWYGLGWLEGESRWIGDDEWLDDSTGWVADSNGPPRYGTEDAPVDLDGNLANNVYVLDENYEGGIPAYRMDRKQLTVDDPNGELPEPADHYAGAKATFEFNLEKIGTCSEDLLAVVAYRDPDDDVDPDAAETQSFARVATSTGSVAPGIWEFSGDGGTETLSFVLPSSVQGPGVLDVWIVPAAQKGIFTGTGSLEMPPENEIRIFDRYVVPMNLQAVSDFGFTWDGDSFPWPKPFYQKKGAEFPVSGLKIRNTGLAGGDLTLRVILCRNENCEPIGTDEPRELSSINIVDLEPNGEFPVADLEVVLPDDLEPAEKWVRIEITGVPETDGNNFTSVMETKKLTEPDENFGLRGGAGSGEGYTFFVGPGGEIRLPVHNSGDEESGYGPGFTVDAEQIVITPADPADEGMLTIDPFDLPDPPADNTLQSSNLIFHVSPDLDDPLRNHVFTVELTSDDLFSAPYEASFEVAVAWPQEPSDVDTEHVSVLPVVARLDEPGIDTPWQSRTWFFNPTADEVRLMVEYTTTPETSIARYGNVFESAGPTTLVRNLVLAPHGTPGSVAEQTDLLREFFGLRSSSKGWVRMYYLPAKSGDGPTTWPSGTPMAAANLYAPGESGNFGQFIPAIPFVRLAGGDDTVRVQYFPNDGQEYRQNLHVTNFGNEELVLMKRAFRKNGASFAEEELDLAAGSVGYLTIPNAAYVELRVLEGESPFAAVGSQVDEGTDDPASVVGRVGGLLTGDADVDGEAPEILVPVVSHAGGTNDSAWRSDLVLTNFGGTDVTLSAVLTPAGGVEDPDEGGEEQTYTVAAGKTEVVSDVYWDILDSGASGSGVLRLSPTDGDATALLATTRSYTVADAGSLGQQIPGFNAERDVVRPGDNAAVIFGLDLAEVSTRLNVGFVNPGGDEAKIVLRLLGSDGAPLRAMVIDENGLEVERTARTVTWTLRAFEWHQRTFDRTSCGPNNSPCLASFFGEGAVMAPLGGQEGIDGAVLTVSAVSGSVFPYLSILDDNTNDPMFLWGVRPDGYGTGLPDDDKSAIEIIDYNFTGPGEPKLEVGEHRVVRITLKDTEGTPLGGFPVTVVSDRDSYFHFIEGEDHTDRDVWKTTDERGVAEFPVTDHAPGISTYHVRYAQSPEDRDEEIFVDIETAVRSRWEFQKMEVAIVDTAMVGEAPVFTVTLEEADENPAWSGLPVRLTSLGEHAPYDTVNPEAGSEPSIDRTGGFGVARFTVETTTIGRSNWFVEVLNVDGDGAVVEGLSPYTTAGSDNSIYTDWTLDGRFSRVDVAPIDPAAGTPGDPGECGGDLLEVTVSVLGANNTGVVDAVVVLTSDNPDDTIEEASLMTGFDGTATFHVRIDPVVLEVPVDITYVATVTPGVPGDESDLVFTIDNPDDADTASWQDENPPAITIGDWALDAGFLSEETAGLVFSTQECVGHVDALDLTVRRGDDGRYWDHGGVAWTAGETWNPATAGPTGPASPDNTWTGGYDWNVPAGPAGLQDPALRIEHEAYDVEWVVRSTDGGNNQPVLSAGTQTVDALVPALVGGYVVRAAQCAGATGSACDPAVEGPLAGEGFDIWSRWAEYFPLTGQSAYQIHTMGDTDPLPVADAPTAAAPAEGSPDVTLLVDTVPAADLNGGDGLRGDQIFVALGGDLVDQSGHDSGLALFDGTVLDGIADSRSRFVRPLPADGMTRGRVAVSVDIDGTPTVCTGPDCSDAAFEELYLHESSLDPAVTGVTGDSTLEYAIIFDVDGDGVGTAVDWWLGHDGSDYSWSHSPEYHDHLNWGLQNGSFTDPFWVPLDLDPTQPGNEIDITTDHQYLVYVHNPWDPADPMPGDALNSVSEPIVIRADGRPVVEITTIPDFSLDQGSWGSINGTFSDDDGAVAQVLLQIEAHDGEFFDGSSWGAGTAETSWFAVTLGAGVWSFGPPADLLCKIDSGSDDLTLRVRAIDDDEGNCDACGDERSRWSCNDHTVGVDLVNQPPQIGITSTLSDLDERGTPAPNPTIEGTVADHEAFTTGALDQDQNGCLGLEVLVRILDTDTGNYWDGAGWVSGEQWISSTSDANLSFDLTADTVGAWTYTLPVGFHSNLGGDLLKISVRAVDASGAVAEVLGQDGSIANDQPVITIESDISALDDGVTVSGNIDDDSRDGTVRLRINDTTSGEYWTGSAWTGTETWITGTTVTWGPSPSGTWSYPISGAAFRAGHGGDDLSVTVEATDTVTNPLTGTATGSGAVANSAPTIQITSSLADLDDGSTIGGTVSDDSSNGSVTILITDTSASVCWDGSGWSGGCTPVTINPSYVSWGASGTWSYPIGSGFHIAGNGGDDLNVEVVATENGPVGATGSDTGTGTIANDQPVITIESDISALYDGVTVSGNINDDSRDGTVRLRINDTTSGEYWTGSAWTGTETWISVTTVTWGPSPSGTWSYPINGAAFRAEHGGDVLSVTVEATDTVTNPLTGTATEAGAVANSAPTIQITSSLAGLDDGSTISGTVSDDSSNGSITILITDTSASVCWDGSGWSGGCSPVTINPAGVSWGPSGTWSYPIGTGFHIAGNGGNALTVNVEATDNVGASDNTGDVGGTIANSAPTVVTNTGASTVVGAAVVITQAHLEATDFEDGPANLTFTITAGPTAGTLSPAGPFTQADINAGSVSYTHDGSATLTDSFDFTVTDSNGDTVTGTFNISILAPPTATLDPLPTPLDDGSLISGAAGDSDGSVVSIELTIVDDITGECWDDTPPSGWATCPVANSLTVATNWSYVTPTGFKAGHLGDTVTVTVIVTDNDGLTAGDTQNGVIAAARASGAAQD